MRSPTLKQLRYFLALCEERHFGRAATRSFVSQSAFSNAIRELETALATQLVDRTNRRVTITAIGQDVATQARLVLRDVESLVDIAQGDNEPLCGELRLGVIPTIAPFILPVVLPRMRKAFPKLQLYLIEDQTQRIYDRLMQGELDVLLLALPWAMHGVEEQVLFRDEFCLAYRQGTKRVDPANYRFNKLDADSVLLLEDGHCLRDHALAACKIRDTEKVRRFGASSLLTLIEMIDADLGISFLPNTRVRLHPLSDKSHRKIGMVWRKGSQRAAEFQLLGEFVRDNC
jgi:LysR family transcriptional regulator, hydrogen peroxide-inducible genes activator